MVFLMQKRSVKRLAKIERVIHPRSRDRLIVFDLEATCWEPEEPDRVEVLEIGAVEIDPHSGEPVPMREFSEIVRPTDTPALSDFCLSLIPIAQSEVDSAVTFAAVFARFTTWLGPKRFWLGSWGPFDREMLDSECRRRRLAMPAGFAGHIDLRRQFARWKHTRAPGLKAAMAAVGLPMVGTAHRALDDARNLGSLTRILVQERARR
jgi:3'-5' exoribonuclease 1